jgi:DNA polymerase-3 subunit chi
MARADFYILNGGTNAERFSCTIAGKAFSQGNSVYIMAADKYEAERLDDLLWTFNDISFLPHACVDVATERTPIVIGWPGASLTQADVMINLTMTVPEAADQFKRVVEIVSEDAAPQGRERYKVYRGRGYEMFNHMIGVEQANG